MEWRDWDRLDRAARRSFLVPRLQTVQGSEPPEAQRLRPSWERPWLRESREAMERDRRDGEGEGERERGTVLGAFAFQVLQIPVGLSRFSCWNSCFGIATIGLIQDCKAAFRLSLRELRRILQDFINVQSCTCQCWYQSRVISVPGSRGVPCREHPSYLRNPRLEVYSVLSYGWVPTPRLHRIQEDRRPDLFRHSRRTCSVQAIPFSTRHPFLLV